MLQKENHLYTLKLLLLMAVKTLGVYRPHLQALVSTCELLQIGV